VNFLRYSWSEISLSLDGRLYHILFLVFCFVGGEPMVSHYGVPAAIPTSWARAGEEYYRGLCSTGGYASIGFAGRQRYRRSSSEGSKQPEAARHRPHVPDPVRVAVWTSPCGSTSLDRRQAVM
jgi:hypothetical protein